MEPKHFQKMLCEIATDGHVVLVFFDQDIPEREPVAIFKCTTVQALRVAFTVLSTLVLRKA